METLSDFPHSRGKAGTLARSRAQVFLLPSKWPSTELGNMVIRAPHLWLRKTSDRARGSFPEFRGILTVHSASLVSCKIGYVSICSLGGSHINPYLNPAPGASPLRHTQERMTGASSGSNSVHLSLRQVSSPAGREPGPPWPRTRGSATGEHSKAGKVQSTGLSMCSRLACSVVFKNSEFIANT